MVGALVVVRVGKMLAGKWTGTSKKITHMKGFRLRNEMGHMRQLSKHDQIRIEHVFARFAQGESLFVVKKSVLKALSGEYDNEIFLISESGVKVPLSAFPIVVQEISS